MHSRIFEVREKFFPKDEWANDAKIANEAYEVDGADYFGVINNEHDRVEDIEDFFTKYFPCNSFKIIENEPGQTAVVEFVGDIDGIYAKWYSCVADAFSGLNESMGTMEVFYLKNALEEPFELSSKFYLEDWSGCTGPVSDFLEWLKYLSRENDGVPFRLYIGQVFDYHF